MIRATILLLLLSLGVKAQMTLENTYTGHWRTTLEKIEGEGFKYLAINDNTKQLIMYNTDHSVWKAINLNLPPAAAFYTLPFYASKTLFNSDSKLEFLVFYGDGTFSGAVLYNEDGVRLQAFDKAAWYDLKKTDDGWKLLLHKYPASGSIQYTEVYSLPGTYAGLQKPGRPEVETGLYPNPMDEQAVLSYTLPAGVQAANLQVYNTAGVMVRSYQVSNMLNAITIQRGELPPGNYVYKLQAPGVEPAAQVFTIR